MEPLWCQRLKSTSCIIFSKSHQKKKKRWINWVMHSTTSWHKLLQRDLKNIEFLRIKSHKTFRLMIAFTFWFPPKFVEHFGKYKFWWPSDSHIKFQVIENKLIYPPFFYDANIWIIQTCVIHIIILLFSVSTAH